jgi:hypothetical protein
MTTKDKIRSWLERAKQENATHMLVVCDTFDYEDYPVFVSESENVREVESKFDGTNMQRVMEVYSLNMDIEKQLSEYRAFHYD